MSTIDHNKEARAWLNGLEDAIGAEGQTDATLLVSPLIAQAHATLALVEQQRIANRIALASLASSIRERGWGPVIGTDPVAIFDYPDDPNSSATPLKADIRKGLGL